MLKHSSAFLALIIFLCASHAYAQQDFSKVEVKAEKVAGNVYMLQGSGGNIGVSVGADGNPDVVPVWPAWQDDFVWVFSHTNSVKVRNLAANPHVVLSSPQSRSA